MKHCRKCDTSKLLEDFPRNRRNRDGHGDWCRSCSNAAQAEWRRRQGKEKLATLNRGYYQNHAKARIECTKRMIDLYPEKRKARHAVQNAIRDGRLMRQPCFRCDDSNTQAHHEDYNRPFDLVWFCSTHHAEHHA